MEWFGTDRMQIMIKAVPGFTLGHEWKCLVKEVKYFITGTVCDARCLPLYY